MSYTWMSGGVPHVISIPKQEPGESDRAYAIRIADLITAAHQQFPPDP